MISTHDNSLYIGFLWMDISFVLSVDYSCDFLSREDLFFALSCALGRMMISVRNGHLGDEINEQRIPWRLLDGELAHT